MVDLVTRDTRVATHNQGELLLAVIFAQKGDKSAGELDNVDGGEVVTGFSADGASDAGDGFD